ncbi:hypothetical protein F4806DRAFT_103846 [Annulohypoxylon nitens]|nr:hypothetical protein F4806DRAFT_103846 [Annulohypoxylon nitens]
MLSLYFIILLFCTLMNSCIAQMDQLDDDSLPYQYYSSNPRTAWPWSPQFELWYPDHREFLTNVSEGICNLTLRDYRAAYRSPRGSPEALKMLSICYRHEACILSQYPPNFQANAQGASVALGFIPALLSASIGPSISEIYLLSIHRPFLATLITLGSPAYQIFKPFEYQHPGKILLAEDGQLQIPVSSRGYAILLCSSEYLFALLAAGIVIFTTVEMGQKAILAWGCTTQFGPLLWAVFALVPQFLVMGGHAMMTRSTDTKYRPKQPNEEHNSRLKKLLAAVRKSLRTLATEILAIINKEITVCANQELRLSVTEKPSPLEVFLNMIAQGMCVVLWCFGVSMFPSMLFMTVHDVFEHIFMPLFFSAIFCRIILMIELAGLRYVMNRNISTV